MDNRMFYVEADNISQHDFELIQKHNEYVVIKSIPLQNFAVLETLIKSLGCT